MHGAAFFPARVCFAVAKVLMPTCLLGLGSNQGDREALLRSAVDALRENPQIAVEAVSSFIATQPVGGPPDQPSYLNGAVRLTTEAPAHQLLCEMLAIERRLGRERRTRWGTRRIDLDLLLYGESVIDTPPLVIPHPRMAFRRFVLTGACEVAGERVHPLIGWPLTKILDFISRPPASVGVYSVAPQAAEKLIRAVGRALKGRDLACGELAGPAASAVGQPGEWWIATAPTRADDFSPRLKILLLAPDDELPCPPSEQRRLQNHVTRSGHGPWLTLWTPSPADAVDEVIAAIEAMRTL